MDTGSRDRFFILRADSHNIVARQNCVIVLWFEDGRSLSVYFEVIWGIARVLPRLIVWRDSFIICTTIFGACLSFAS